MAYQIIDSVEAERGCGYRKGGGLYLVSGASANPCGKLPLAIPDICSCCGNAITPNRGFSWISSLLIDNSPCAVDTCQYGCFPFSRVKKYLLMWVGEKFYKTNVQFMAEAHAQGISKRIAKLPKDFSVGVDWVLLAHRHCLFDKPESGTIFQHGIFSAFCPERVDYIVKGDEDPITLQKLTDKGITLINVIPLYPPAHVIADSDSY